MDVTYYPDNFQVDVEIRNQIDTYRAPEVTDPSCGPNTRPTRTSSSNGRSGVPEIGPFMKQMIVTLSEAGEVISSTRSPTGGPDRHAPWALSVMTAGGIGISTPPYAHGPGALARAGLVYLEHRSDRSPAELWRNTSPSSRIRGPKNPSSSDSRKPGLDGYALEDQLFVETGYYPKTYPTWARRWSHKLGNGKIESLGPLVNLKPGETTYHRERWQLYKIEPVTQTEESLDKVILPLKLGS